MRRYFIKRGDKTTSAGVVTEGVGTVTHHGTELSFLGAQVYCHTCKSVGHIAPQGPRRPFRMKDKEAALDNDLCMCKCDPPPRLIASQNSMSQSFETHEEKMRGYAPNGASATQNGLYDQHFLLTDIHTGKRLADAPYWIAIDNGQEIEGRTDASGHTLKVSSGNVTNATIHVFEEHPPINPDWDQYL